jgi:hypothetical protein
MTAVWGEVPLVVETDPRHGGRWTSLRSPDREWLWTNPEREVGTARALVSPGDPFVDAGGVEECFPTVRGQPDHGHAWSRPWRGVGSPAQVFVPGDLRLHRSIRRGSGLEIDYTTSGRSGSRFVHVVHALLDVGSDARLEVPGTHAMHVLDVQDPIRPWPSGLDRLGPDDGTAVCAVIPYCREVVVVDGEHSLRFAWDSANDPDLCSLMVWRNLRGWPATGPYRSIGVEPMVGRVADLSLAGPGDCAELDGKGRFSWTVRISAHRLS